MPSVGWQAFAHSLFEWLCLDFVLESGDGWVTQALGSGLIRRIGNEARDYAWGSTTLIPDYFGVPATGKPMAEIWFGTHAGSPTRVLNQDHSDAGTLLDLRQGQPLDFLLKLLAAGQPLSLQAHPNSAQAAEGFARENALGLALDAANRNYKDDKHKPEMLVALTPFQALGGFRPIEQIEQLFGWLAGSEVPQLATAFSGWLSVLRAEGLRALFVQLLQVGSAVAPVTQALAEHAEELLAEHPGSDYEQHLGLVLQLQQHYPGDPGVVASLLLNFIELQPGEAVQIAAGQIHAYVSGLGVEIMAASDNVLRGGLTPKHIDTAELQRVLDFAAEQVPVLTARELAAGLWQYPRQCDDFLLYRLELDGTRVLADLKLANPAIVLCTAGQVAVSDSTEAREVLTKGEAAYLADARFSTFAGSGTVFLATN